MTRKGNKVQKKILRIMSRESKPYTTRELAVEMKVSWHTVQDHCQKLVKQGQLESMRVSTTHVWTMKKQNPVDLLLQQTLDQEIALLKRQLEEMMKKKEEQEIIVSHE